MRAGRGQGSPSQGNLYLLWGAEGPLREEALAGLLGEILRPERAAWNLEKVNVPESGAEEIIARAESLPFGASQRIIVVRGIEDLPAAGRERLLGYLEQRLPPHVCLIFTIRKMDRKNPLLSALQRMATLIPCGPKSPRQMEEWLAERASNRGVQLTPSAFRALVDWVGENPDLLAAELEKVILWVGSGAEIREEDVWALAGERTHLIFEAMNALGDGRVGEAVRGLRSLLNQGEEALSILGMISRHIRLLMRTKEMQGRGESPPEIARALRVPSNYLNSLLTHASRISEEALGGAFHELLQIDSLLKSEKGLGRFALERLMIQLGRRSPVRS